MNEKTVFGVILNTSTMIFASDKEATMFLQKFDYMIPKFFELQEEKNFLNFEIKAKKNFLHLIWIFETREEYITFHKNLSNTNFFHFTRKIGWKIEKAASGML
jgi:hypothetical protein